MSPWLSFQMKTPRHKELVPLPWGHTARGAELLLLEPPPCASPGSLAPTERAHAPKCVCVCPQAAWLPQRERTPLSVFVCLQSALVLHVSRHLSRFHNLGKKQQGR